MGCRWRSRRNGDSNRGVDRLGRGELDRFGRIRSWVLSGPSGDVLRVRDHFPVVENEYRNVALPGEPLDLPATLRDVGQEPEAVRPHYLRRVPRVLEGVERLLAGVRLRTPRSPAPRPRDGEGSPADVELHDQGLYLSCATGGQDFTPVSFPLAFPRRSRTAYLQGNRGITNGLENR